MLLKPLGLVGCFITGEVVFDQDSQTELRLHGAVLGSNVVLRDIRREYIRAHPVIAACTLCELGRVLKLALGAKWLTPFRRPPERVKACDDRGSYVVAFGPTRHRSWVMGQPLQTSSRFI